MERKKLRYALGGAYIGVAPILERFLLGTGRMPHPVGGAIGVTLCYCRERGYTIDNIPSPGLETTHVMPTRDPVRFRVIILGLEWIDHRPVAQQLT